MSNSLPTHETQSLLHDIRTLIDEGKQHLAVTVNAAEYAGVGA